jgi:hypothetical protein
MAKEKMRTVTIRALRIALLTEANKTWMVPHGVRLLVGKGPNVDIVVPDPYLPMRCFALDFMKGPWCQIRDLESPVPIMLNNRRVQGPKMLVDLRDGDQLVITAKSRFGFSYTSFQL